VYAPLNSERNEFASCHVAFGAFGRTQRVARSRTVLLSRFLSRASSNLQRARTALEGWLARALAREKFPDTSIYFHDAIKSTSAVARELAEGDEIYISRRERGERERERERKRVV